MGLRTVVIVVAAVCALGSATKKPIEEMNWSPIMRTPPGTVERIELYTAMLQVLNGLGYMIETKDADAVLVSTEWIDVGGGFLHRWRVTLFAGKLVLYIDCRLAGETLVLSCNDLETRVAAFARDGKPLMDLIMRYADDARRSRAVPDIAPPSLGGEGERCHIDGTCKEGLTCEGDFCEKQSSAAPQ